MEEVMRHGATIIGIFLTMSLPAFGQAPNCSTIPDDKDRLACYDAAAAKPTAVPKSPPQAVGDPTIVKARTAVSKSLRDPPSTRFESVVRKPEAVCGLVNGKNAYGGYAGNTRFAYVISSGDIFIEMSPTLISPSTIGEYDRIDAALKRYCPGVRSPFIRD
jgi:hypothetical protein